MVLVGAIHGGYEWNTALLSYELIDHFALNPDIVPASIEVIVIPVANPDGLYGVVGTSERFLAEDAPQFAYASEVSPTDSVVTGRFNANGIDLNRNFDCGWQPEAVWRNQPVSAGTAPFSEPESRALRDFMLSERPAGVIFFHSAGGGVYASGCNGEIFPPSKDLSTVYGESTEYGSQTNYAPYVVTGDATDWLAKEKIPAITVEFSTHDDIEWEKNLSGVKAVLKYFSENE